MPNSSDKSYTQKANPNATNSELEAKIILKNDIKRRKIYPLMIRYQVDINTTM